MQKNPVTSLVLNIDPLLRRWGLPYWTWAQIRKLRVGQELLLVDFLAPCGAVEGVVSVTIERMRGGIFRLDAGWIAHLGKNAWRRGHLWAQLDFRMLTGRQLELIPRKSETGADYHFHALRQIEVVMRRASLLARWAKRDGDREASWAMTPAAFMTRYHAQDGALAWLDKMRGPGLKGAADLAA
ncbi:hypothetical protein [Burkholderia ubonensis]|uniref:hypothetical protein n=1 Tax=Burkholderia ubonensis TaxID=101571 RepID=UPI0007537E12|nr:hypothetical protein [Burkholderia ubonensis]KVP39870.1 hypothetical protein WJ87_06715 [Burkholderia ubonensis]